MTRELVMYSRRMGCPYVTVAKRVLDDYHVPYREILIDMDDTARQRVLRWTGFLSVPTLVVAETGSDVPFQDPAPLAAGVSPRGIHRGTMITEPSADQLADWLAEHGFINEL
ncbi:MAG: glutaredoxin [Chloroflexi bacterium]|nr:glutaredoxin [Chloroflexota bacterium]